MKNLEKSVEEIIKDILGEVLFNSRQVPPSANHPTLGKQLVDAILAERSVAEGLRKEVEKSHEYVREHGASYRGEIVCLKKRIEVLEEALKTYANIASWGSGICTNVMVRGMKGFEHGWELAKEALKAEIRKSL